MHFLKMKDARKSRVEEENEETLIVFELMLFFVILKPEFTPKTRYVKMISLKKG